MLELRNEVGKHAAGHLIDKRVYVYLQYFGAEEAVGGKTFGNSLEVLG